MLDQTWRTTREAEHAVLGLTATGDGGDIVRMATHFDAGRVLVTSETSDGRLSVHGADVTSTGLEHTTKHLLRLHAARTGGRLFRFRGAEHLVGVVSVRDILADSEIDDVVIVGRREPLEKQALVHTQGFVRPLMLQGRTALVVRPAANGLAVPFEQPNPTPCCASH